MTNHLPSFEENQSPENNNGRYVNITSGETWQHFLDVAQNANDQFIGFDESTPGSSELLESYNRRLNTYIDIEFSEQKALVLGLANIIDINDNPTGEEYLLTELDDVIFDGVGLYPINNKWRVQLMFYSQQTADNAACYYYVPLDKHHILDLQILAPSSNEQDNDLYDGVVAHLISSAVAAADLTSSNDFLAMPADKQHNRLRRETADICKNFLPQYAGTNVSISCTQYYAVPDDMAKMELPIEMFFTDQSDLRQDEMFEPSGMMYDCAFLEQDQDPERHFTKPADFNLAFGAPCLHVYDDKKKCTYYILPQTISRVYLPEETGKSF